MKEFNEQEIVLANNEKQEAKKIENLGQIVEQLPEVDTNIFDHATVMKTAGIIAPVGGYVGSILIKPVAMEAAQNVSKAVEKEILSVGNKSAEGFGLHKIPLIGRLFEANVQEVAEQARRKAYDETNTAVTNQGAAIGGAAAGLGTIIAMETANLLSYGYHNTIGPVITNYYNGYKKSKYETMAAELDAQNLLAIEDKPIIPSEIISEKSENTLSI